MALTNMYDNAHKSHFVLWLQTIIESSTVEVKELFIQRFEEVKSRGGIVYYRLATKYYCLSYPYILCNEAMPK